MSWLGRLNLVTTFQFHSQLLLAISLCLLGCQESPPELERIVIAEKYVLQEVSRDESIRAREMDLRLLYKDQEFPVSRLFIHQDLIITLSPTPTQSDSIGPVGNYQAIGNGWTRTTELFLDGSGLMLGSPHGTKYPHERLKEIVLEEFVTSNRGKPFPAIYLTIGQATEYSQFVEVFTALNGCTGRIGLGFYVQIDP